MLLEDSSFLECLLQAYLAREDIKKAMEEKIKYKNTSAVISGIMLLFATTSLQYGYYILLRWVVTASAIFLVWLAYDLEKQFWVIVMGVVALLFNPVAPVYLNKGTWVVIDFVVAILFFTSIFKITSDEEDKG